MNDYTELLRKVGIGQTPQLCQDALIELMKELFEGKRYNGQEGLKELKVFKQNLPVTEQVDDDADTDAANAPYLLVKMTGGEILDEDSPQIVEFNLLVCAYDASRQREGWQDVANIKETIIQRACTQPYFGGVFTLLKPITWAMQEDDTYPYYYGACVLRATAPAMTQDSTLQDFL